MAKIDPEMQAAARIMKELGRLHGDAQQRVLRYLADRYFQNRTVVSLGHAAGERKEPAIFSPDNMT